MNEEMSMFKKWWYMILFLVVISAITFGVLGYFNKITSTIVERNVFEQSYQKKAGDSQRMSTYRAQLAQVNRRLSTENDSEIVKQLMNQKAMLEAQIQAGQF